jgi:phospholipid transport system substrate-binding protein
MTGRGIMPSMLRILSSLFLLLQALALSLPAAAQELGPEALVKQITEEVLEAVQKDKALQEGDRQKAMRLAEEKILPHVDFQEATRLALGRSWQQATPEQRARLVDEFRGMLVRTYSHAIDAYRGQTMRVLPVRMKPGDTDVTVRNQYSKPGERPVIVEYAMHKTPEGWKVYDIAVEGVSLVLTYRSEFDAVVRQSGIDGLIQRLAQRNEPPKLPAGKS